MAKAGLKTGDEIEEFSKGDSLLGVGDGAVKEDGVRVTMAIEDMEVDGVVADVELGTRKPSVSGTRKFVDLRLGIVDASPVVLVVVVLVDVMHDLRDNSVPTFGPDNLFSCFSPEGLRIIKRLAICLLVCSCLRAH